MALNRKSAFGAADGLFDKSKEDTDISTRSTGSTGSTGSTRRYTQDVQDVHEKLPQTQGKKGAKAKRINMAFSDENHEWIKRESRRQGISATQYVNDIVAQERKRLGY